MKSEISLLRTLIWSQFIAAIAGGVLSGALAHHLPFAVQEFNEQLVDQMTVLDVIIGIVLIIGLLLSFVGLLLMRPWAKTLYLVTLLGSLLTVLFGGPVGAEPGAASALLDTAAVLVGATLFQLYFTDFGRNWENLRR